jgi:hypothetical protein
VTRSGNPRFAISGLLLSDLPVLVFVFSPRREVVVAMLKPHTDFGWHGHDDMSNAEKTMLIRTHSFASRSVNGGDGGITDGETKTTVLQIHDAAQEEEGGGVEMIHYDNPMGTAPMPALVTPTGTSTLTRGSGMNHDKEGKEDAGLSLEGHDSSIITRMQATQRMKQAQRQYEDEHGIHV